MTAMPGMHQDFSAPALGNPGNVSMRGVEDWGARSSRALSSGAGVVRRRMTAGTGLEPLPLQPLRRSAANFGAAPALGGIGLPSPSAVGPKAIRQASSPLDVLGRQRELPTGGANSVLTLSRAPLFPSGPLQKPNQRESEVQAACAKRPPKSEGQFGSRPHGLSLRHEVPGATSAFVARSSSSPREERRRSAAAIDGEALNTSSERGHALTGGSGAKSDSKEAASSPASPAVESATSGPKYAAKCAAVANLQRLFFEEVGRSGDANAAAATALLRLAEESRPAAELSPRRTLAEGVQRDLSRTRNIPSEDDLVVREAEDTIGL